MAGAMAGCSQKHTPGAPADRSLSPGPARRGAAVTCFHGLGWGTRGCQYFLDHGFLPMAVWG